MAAPIGTRHDKVDPFSLIFALENGLEALSDLPSLAAAPSGQLPSDWDPNVNPNNDILSFQTSDPWIIDPAKLSEPISEDFELSNVAYRLPNEQTDRLVEQPPI